jgi:hypothetical protein
VHTVPDYGEPQNNLQAAYMQEYLEVLIAAINGQDCVLSGGAVSAQGSPDMTVAVAKAGVLSAGALFAVAAGNATITTADATNPRIDLVVVNSSGALAVRAGTPAAAPKPAARSTNDVVLAAVYVPANDTTISSAQIVDMRCFQSGPIVIAKSTAGVTFSNSLAEQTLFSATIPNGLFLAGKRLRFKAAGYGLQNGTGGGSRNITVRIKFGATTMFADVTTNYGNDNRYWGWQIDAELTAVGDSSQTLTGAANMGTGALTAPTTGTAGDLATAESSYWRTAFRGTASEGADSANKDFVLTEQMSLAQTTFQIWMDHATLELL